MANKVGRPSSYKETYCNEVKEHLAQGFSLESFAGTIGVTPQTCNNWMNEHREFFEAVKIGRAKGMLVWETSLMNQARTGQGNTAAHIFAMKNLYQDAWRDKQDHDHSHTHRVLKRVEMVALEAPVIEHDEDEFADIGSSIQ